MQLGQPRCQIALLELILAGQTKLIQVTFIQNYSAEIHPQGLYLSLSLTH